MPNGSPMESRLLDALVHATVPFIVDGLVGLGQLSASQLKLNHRLVVGGQSPRGLWGSLLRRPSCGSLI